MLSPIYMSFCCLININMFFLPLSLFICSFFFLPFLISNLFSYFDYHLSMRVSLFSLACNASSVCEIQYHNFQFLNFHDAGKFH